MSEYSYDVVVVGGGIAGLSAAVSATEHGAKVALLDRASATEMGGNTRYTEAYLRMKNLDEPAEGLAETLLDDFMGHPDPSIIGDAVRDPAKRSPLLRAHQVIDIDYVERFADQAPDTLAWLTTHGVTFDALPTLFLTVSTTRMAPVGGGLALVETLGKVARAKGVDVHVETTARSLEVGADGAVTGVRARTKDGAVTFRGRVVLASGGYQGNAEMMARYHGPLALTCRPVAKGGNYNKGEGIQMALDIGAATAGNFSLFHAEPIDPRSGEPEAALMCFPYGVLVNIHGERFVDEARGPIDAWYERGTRDIQGQPTGMAWIILDAQGMAVPNIRTGIRTDQPSVKADSIAALAAKIEVPVEALEATVAAYNAACPSGEGYDPLRPDGVATAGLTPPKSNWARPIATAPFEAYPIMAANVFTFGGLKTTPDAEVLDRDGDPIRGLYAAGEMTGLYYSNYTGSTSVLRGAVFGRIAGREAAAASGAAGAASPSPAGA